MGLRWWECTRCGEKQLAFLNEKKRLVQGNCMVYLRWCHDFQPLPPDPSVVHCTNTYMSEPQLDSLKTIYELDRILNIEARDEKELKILQEARINM